MKAEEKKHFYSKPLQSVLSIFRLTANTKQNPYVVTRAKYCKVQTIIAFFTTSGQYEVLTTLLLRKQLKRKETLVAFQFNGLLHNIITNQHILPPPPPPPPPPKKKKKKKEKNYIFLKEYLKTCHS